MTARTIRVYHACGHHAPHAWPNKEWGRRPEGVSVGAWRDSFGEAICEDPCPKCKAEKRCPKCGLAAIA